MSLLQNISNRISRPATPATLPTPAPTLAPTPVATPTAAIRPRRPVSVSVAAVVESIGSLTAEGLKRLLDTQDNIPDQTRTGQAGHIHVSSLIGFCDRRHALLRLYGSAVPELRTVDGAMKIVWAMGRAIETHVRASLLAADGRHAFGVWTCPCRQDSHRGHRPDRLCPRCNQRLSTYNEYTLVDESAGVAGNPDYIRHINNLMQPFEIKSMNKKAWDVLTISKGDHVFQVAWYWHLLHRLGFEMHNRCLIIYVSKDYSFGSPYKVFEIDPREPTLVMQIETASAMAVSAHRAVADNSVPARVCCTSFNDPMAKKCPAVGQCFSRA